MKKYFAMLLAVGLVLGLSSGVFAQNKVLISVRGAEDNLKAISVATNIWQNNGYEVVSLESSADLIAKYTISMGGANAFQYACLMNRDSGYANITLSVKDKQGKELFNHASSGSAKENVIGCWIPYVGFFYSIYIGVNPAKKIREKALVTALNRVSISYFRK